MSLTYSTDFCWVEPPKEHPRKPRKSKKPKDVHAPKRSLSSYLIFCNDNRSRVREQNPGLKTISQISKKMSEEWKAIKESNPELKQEYDSRAKQLKDKYLQDVSEYKQTQAYRDYQQKIAEWKGNKNSNANSNSNSNSNTSSNPKPKRTKRISKQKMSEKEIKTKIASFFRRYKTALRKAEYAKPSVCDQYGYGLLRAVKWISTTLGTETDVNQGDSALFAFHCLAAFDVNIDMMDFSYGGPFAEILMFMQCIDKFITNQSTSVNLLDEQLIRQLYRSLIAYGQEWDQYGLGDKVQETVDKFKQAFSL